MSIIRRSPKNRKIQIISVVIVLIATIFTSVCCGNGTDNIIGETTSEKKTTTEIQTTQEITTTEIVTTTKVTTTTTPTTKAVVTTAKPTTTKATTVATTKPVTTTVKSNTEETKNDNNERTNKLYYVDDNGYKSYFDECYQNYLYDLCVQYGITEYYTLLIAQIYHESTFRTNLISSTNDYGLMQINACNHSWLRNKLGISDFLNPYENMQAGVYMMSSYLHKYGDAEKALVCYNLGEGGAKGVSSTSYSRGVLYDKSLLVELN